MLHHLLLYHVYIKQSKIKPSNRPFSYHHLILVLGWFFCKRKKINHFTDWFLYYLFYKNSNRNAIGGDTRIRTGDQSFADSCLTTWLYRRLSMNIVSVYWGCNSLCSNTLSNLAISPFNTSVDKKMERETGLKPATFALATRRSINWAIPAKSKQKYNSKI